MTASQSPGFRTSVDVLPRNLPRQVPEFLAVRRVLVVDDESLIRWSVAETLRDRGYTVVEVSTGSAALRALWDFSVSFDVVVLDFRLPDSNDLTLLARILGLRPEVRVILMTAYGTREILHDAILLGAYRAVSKPFELNDLADLVAEAIEAGPS